MEELLLKTGLLNDNKIVNEYLEANNIKTVKDLINLEVDYIKEVDLKNMLRGLQNLLEYKYSSRPLPFDAFLKENIKFKYNDNAYLTVDFGIIDFRRMGISFSEELDLKAWAKIMNTQYDKKEITLIELMKSFVLYGKDTKLAEKLDYFIDYYDKDQEILKSENTMSKFFYLRSKVDIMQERLTGVVERRNGLGDRIESRRTY